MKWEHCFWQYLERHCTVRGLRVKSIAAYGDILHQYKDYMEKHFQAAGPEKVTTRDVLEYVEYLRSIRRNGDSAVNRTVTVLRNFYRALVALGYMEYRDNPMQGFPMMKAPKRKFREVLTVEEMGTIIAVPRTDTIMGLRDRSILVLLYGTGMRATECAGLQEKDVRLEERNVKVTGKGGNERTIPLNDDVIPALAQYRAARGPVAADAPFYKSRKGAGGLSRNAIYERVRYYARKARIAKQVSPHTLRHTFATHLIRNKVNLVTLKELLGHRQLSSTQIYIHMTAEDVREAMALHPIRNLINTVKSYFPGLKLPFQHPPGTRFAFRPT
jgi:integrase/recombinase XerD